MPLTSVALYVFLDLGDHLIHEVDSEASGCLELINLEAIFDDYSFIKKLSCIFEWHFRVLLFKVLSEVLRVGAVVALLCESPNRPLEFSTAQSFLSVFQIHCFGFGLGISQDSD